eukprot:3879293-Pyramimonas_sp.AAC.1
MLRPAIYIGGGFRWSPICPFCRQAAGGSIDSARRRVFERPHFSDECDEFMPMGWAQAGLAAGEND